MEQLTNDRSYKALWTRYRGRVLIAMSSQALAQMVSDLTKTKSGFASLMPFFYVERYQCDQLLCTFGV